MTDPTSPSYNPRMSLSHQLGKNLQHVVTEEGFNGIAESDSSSDDTSCLPTEWDTTLEEEHAWRRMSIKNGDGGDRGEGQERTRRILIPWLSTLVRYMKMHWTVLLVSSLVFGILLGAGLGMSTVFANAQKNDLEEDALDLAMETGRFFRNELDRATASLYSLAQFAAEIPAFRDLPESIGPRDLPGSLPYLSSTHRNLTGSMCEDSSIVERFEQIAATIKHNAKMKRVLILLELVPEGVVCMVYPPNNTHDFPPGQPYDSSGSLGLDLLSDPMKSHGETTLTNGDAKITIAGPIPLKACPDCNPQVKQAFVARLPIRVAGHHYMDVPSSNVGGTPARYPYWGFAVAKINWGALVESSDMYNSFQQQGSEFLLTREDELLNIETGSYDKHIVVLAESPGYHPHTNSRARHSFIKTAIMTADGEWEMTVAYDGSCPWQVWVIPVCVLLSLSIAYLVFLILVQKHEHTEMVGWSHAQDARVETEKNMTAYFAHELRNPLGAIDSALHAMPEEEFSKPTKELVDGMRLCSSFMSNIMNNLLDVRKMEEGNMTLRRMPLALDRLVEGLHLMLLPSVRKGVDFQWKSNIQSTDRNWVIGDIHRIQQIFTSVIANALKFTASGSVIVSIGWEDDYEVVTGSRPSINSSTRKKSLADRPPRVRFNCADTGPGIPKQEQKDVFKKFVKRNGAPGTGLGLAIAKHLVDVMNGTICFDSDPTVKPGATCIVMLPLPPCQKPENLKIPDEKRSFQRNLNKERKSEEKPRAKPEKPKPMEEKINFLIVDDIKMNRMMLKRRFQKGVAVNSRISEAPTGEEALELCKRETFDVIIMDQYMEEAGGVIRGTDAIIAMRRMGITCLIIGCSGNELNREFHEAGADHVWQKPVPSNAKMIEQLRGYMKHAKMAATQDSGAALESTETASDSTQSTTIR